MATYILTAKVSQATVKGLMDKPEDRWGALEALVSAAGGRMTQYWFTTGDSDILMVLEADGPEVPAKVAMIAAAAGAASDTQIRRAWSTAEFGRIAGEAAETAHAYRMPGA